MTASSQQTPETATNDYRLMAFIVEQMLNRVATVTLVKIVKVTNDGAAAAVGFVDVQPLVNQMSGDREATPHGVVYNIPYFRLQGGANAVILDPQVGDLGLCAFCSRDISAVKKAKGQANPGSQRTFDYADGLYIGGFLNGIPTQVVRFSAEGIELKSPTKVRIEAPAIELDGPVTATSTIVAETDVTGGGVSLKNHTHGGVQAGGSNTGPPNA